MLILPAIDLLEGRCVRLQQGRFDQMTVYSDDPVAQAHSFVEEGAEALHIVDLEGARLGKAKNLDVIYRIRQQVQVPIQVGGGIRSFAVAAQIYKAGIERIIYGTAAAEDQGLLGKILTRYPPERVAAGVDVREGRVVVEGWEKETERSLEDILDGLQRAGVSWVVFTDVNRDGMLAGVGGDMARSLVDAGFKVIVAGGVATAEDIKTARDAGAAGCIVGSALYTGSLTLPQALEAARAD